MRIAPPAVNYRSVAASFFSLYSLIHFAFVLFAFLELDLWWAQLVLKWFTIFTEMVYHFHVGKLISQWIKPGHPCLGKHRE